MTDDELLGLVAARFEVTGADTPGWPDPRRAGGPPLDEEYSRLLDPGKYRIVRARVEAWGQALTSLGAVSVEPIDPSAWPSLRGLPADTASRWTPSAPGALAIVVTHRSIGGVPDGVLEIGAGEPLRLLLSKPECGCDACDDGSEALLEEIDEFLLSVVTGDLVRVELPGGRLQASRRGWEASGDLAGDASGVEQLLADARAGASPYPVTGGASWL